MAIVRPFKAIRPTRDKANLVASRSYLSYSDETLNEKLEHNPFTFLHIINPDYNGKIKKKGIEKFNALKEIEIEIDEPVNKDKSIPQIVSDYITKHFC